MFHQSIRENEVSAVAEYGWDSQNRLKQVNLPDGSEHRYQYDYRTRRLRTEQVGGNQAEVHTAILFSGGLSVAEWEAGSAQGITLNGTPNVEYTRGPDMGGGVGGLLYGARTPGGAAGPTAAVVKYNLSNGRGDIVAQTDSSGALTWTASYEAFGKRTKETGQNQDKQRANSKDEDPTGLLNEGFRYRDIETGGWLSRDPAGFVDGPNLYAYVQQNPWSKFDPHGLSWEGVGDYFSEVGEVWKGYGDAAVGMAKGIGQVVAHPIDTAKNVGKAVMSPVQTAKAIANQYGDKWESGARGQGEIIGEVLLSVATGGATKAAAQSGTVAKLVDKVADVSEVAGKGVNLFRRSSGPGSPMEAGEFQRIQTAFQRQSAVNPLNSGTTKVMQSSAETGDFMKSLWGVEAATPDADTILLGASPTRSAVFEELIHTAQLRRGMTSRNLMEIQAK